MDDVSETPPTNIDPYSTLGLDPTASDAQVKTAYKKLALKHHPDKVPPSDRSAAHTTFQNIAFAYAILSNPKRRNLYDTTGSTSETLNQDDDDFDWLSFFRTQFTQDFATDLEEFSLYYKGSEEEKKNLLTAYHKHEGKWNKIYQDVMLSNPLDDEPRFKDIILQASLAKELKRYDADLNESEKSKEARQIKARREAKEAEKEQKTNKAYQSIFGGDGKGGPKDMDSLAAAIQARNQKAGLDMAERVLEKYGPGGVYDNTEKKGKKRKKGVQELDEDEPSEEAFQRTQKKMLAKTAKEGKAAVNGTAKGKGKTEAKGKSVKKAKAAAVEDDEDDEEIIDLEKPSDGEEEESEEEVAEEGLSEEVKPKPKPEPKAKAKVSKKAPPPATKGKGTRSRAKK
ncbi:MAG: hypothetical protein Q9218_000948 [Villophora microphyllina]